MAKFIGQEPIMISQYLIAHHTAPDLYACQHRYILQRIYYIYHEINTCVLDCNDIVNDELKELKII